MDFFKIKEVATKQGELEIFPDFKIGRSEDLMIRGNDFYAVWNEEKGLWSTDEFDVQKIIDKSLWERYEQTKDTFKGRISVKTAADFSTRTWSQFQLYKKNLPDNYVQLDDNLTFQDTVVKKKDYVSKRLPYSVMAGSMEAYSEIINTLYEPEEVEKIEWAIGSLIAGDAKNIQKFIVLYGKPGVGKGTIIGIVEKLFSGYYTTFDAKALAGQNNQFSTDVFKDNPLVAIQHDGDLSRISDNSKLNSIVSHELMNMNEKFKSSYTARVNALLFMGTNNPVKISDSKSGIIRRLIDVNPIGVQIPPKRYHDLVSQVDFELGAIANHCLSVYRKLGKNYYEGYQPIEMMYQTDTFFNFVEDNYFIFRDMDGVTLTQAWDMYNVYADDAGIEKGKGRLQRQVFREQLKDYFSDFQAITRIDGKQVRSYYSGFLIEKFQSPELDFDEVDKPPVLILDEEISIFDSMYPDIQGQYAVNDIPGKKWADVTTTLKNLDTSRTHYVRPPENHIVIDFDLTDADGNKDRIKNIEAAELFPPTYAEYSNGGNGIHLHYIYDGDVTKLSRLYDHEIEVKVFTGNSSLRRRVSKCNNIPVATISSGLPLKEKKMINTEIVHTENSIRDMIKRNLNKEIHSGTKSSVDFIHKILEDAYDSGVVYDVSDMKNTVLAFAMRSTNQKANALKTFATMKWKSEDESDISVENTSDSPIIFYDIEVYPNLLLIVWKKRGGDHVVMINPKPEQMLELFNMKLVGFNNRRYDNHVLFGRHLGQDNEQIYQLSKGIISNNRDALFREAYGLSYTDIYDYTTNKQSLKKWEVELGITHKEMELDWDKPVPEELWDTVIEYCKNDVDATEAVFLATQADWKARQILADMSGLTNNDTTQRHTAKIIFGNEKNPQKHFIYTDLSEMFPGYEFKLGKSTYRGEDPSEGGRVYSEPGMYNNVGVLDIKSMHPTSLILLKAFGKYTPRFEELYEARQAINERRLEDVHHMLGGILSKYIIGASEEELDDLSYALKTAINIVYGMTSATFENIFKDPKNIDNIVAKRGALFMIDLQKAVEEKGWNVVHIKTDSIKLADLDQEKIDFVVNFGKEYGYTFVHETTFSKFLLINKAVYIGKVLWDKKPKKIGTWDAVGAQFKQPYVYKTLFSKEPVELEDLREIKTVTSQMYLNMNEDILTPEDVEHEINIQKNINRIERRMDKLKKEDITPVDELDELQIEKTIFEDQLSELSDATSKNVFIGSVGAFLPIKPGCGGGLLRRYDKVNNKFHAVNGTKGYRWLEYSMVEELGKEEDIDMSYYRSLVDDTVEDIAKYGDVEQFLE